MLHREKIWLSRRSHRPQTLSSYHLNFSVSYESYFPLLVYLLKVMFFLSFESYFQRLFSPLKVMFVLSCEAYFQYLVSLLMEIIDPTMVVMCLAGLRLRATDNFDK